ncbi:restriction endonuclease subunit S [Nonomuraea sp. NPDC049709]|uniref:restriction endonuclease subunit S n=1 Tax=Nonomuraea sp. NPDC049709 TaxID=3154736 RepID=UPI00341959E0
MRELPEGWKPLRLRDAGIWLSGGTPSTDEPRFWGGDIPWISAASMKNFYIHDSDRRLTKSGSSAGTQIVGEGSVLFVVRGMSLKKEFRVGVTQRELAFGQDCKAIIPRQDIDGTFLALALRVAAGEILSMVDEAGHGTGRLPTDMISRLEIGIPPLPEQRRIVEILNTLDFRIENQQAILEKLKNVTTAVVTDQLTRIIDPTEAVLPLAALASVTSGVTLGTETGGSVELPYLRVANVQDGFIDTSEMKSVRVSRADAKRYLLEAGDVLLTEGGDLDKLGRGAVWDARIDPCICQNHVFRVRCERTLLLPEYLAAFSSSHQGKRYFLSIAKQTTNLASINSSQLKNMPIPLPSIELQKRLIDVANTGAGRINHESSELQRLNLLKQGLLEDLLTGEVRVSDAEAVLENL